ncbi:MULTISPECIES: PTS galactosamine transporter subunit IIB [Tissierellales]|uniref:PTS N-acetylgalactosamine transporter subunit IIB n=1 Tax=Acidilutibacter cellobiosedens TaxID=2507161 RepID=A0A410QG66_9FIRM|nr:MULTISPECIES: PTS galactosamine transporter subunit IIB [Tissierellales]MBE6083090.1 PTS N-acetylgalactosamine transporter subunit IIB [Tissierellaceae bacterium]QAT62824.1 PTS N-acetylgalactosamine transporter subunit IIB [Acidilutibacter cellobiosedens]SCL93172.1 EIIAB-Man [Sporanaerobacter sp. PP17-6a]
MKTPNILWTRIDNRLVHGQVGVTWTTTIRPNLMIVVDDETANDKIQQELMQMTAESVGVGIRFFSVQKCIDVIFKASPSQKIFIIARTPETVRKLVEGGVPIKLCNIGNMHYSEGKKVSRDVHVYLDEKDLEDLRAIRNMGVDVFIQITPNDHKLDFEI